MKIVEQVLNGTYDQSLRGLNILSEAIVYMKCQAF